MVRREAVEVEETRLDCVWPIFFKVKRTRRAFNVTLSFRGQWVVLSKVILTLPVDNVNSQLKGLIILIERMMFAF